MCATDIARRTRDLDATDVGHNSGKIRCGLGWTRSLAEILLVSAIGRGIGELISIGFWS